MIETKKPSVLRCTVVTSREEFAALEPAWRRLHGATPIAGACASWPWAWLWWKHFAQLDGTPLQRELHVVCVTDAEGEFAAIAPCYIETNKRFPWQPKRLRPFGALPLEPGPIHETTTDEPVLLLRVGDERAALHALMTHLATGPDHRKWDLLEMSALQPEEDLSVMPDALTQCGLTPNVYTGTGSQLAALPETWDLFRATLTRSMKDNLPYYPRKLSKKITDWAVEEIRDPVAASPVVERLIDLHNLRAESARGTSHISHLPLAHQQAFFRDVMASLIGEGNAFLSLLKVEGAVVAAQAFSEFDGTVTFYYSGYEAEYYDYSPVTIIEQMVIRSAIARGVRRLNFLPEPAMWKQRWGAADTHRLQTVRAFAPHPRGRMLAGLRGAYRMLRPERPAEE